MRTRRRTPVRDAGQDGESHQKVKMEKHLKIAIFIDFDNIEIGVKSTLQREFDVSVVLEALKERGEIVTKIAYANWGTNGKLHPAAFRIRGTDGAARPVATRR